MAEDSYNAKHFLEEYMKNASHFTAGLIARFEPLYQKTNTILKAFQHFNRTGEINDVLQEFIQSKAQSSKENDTLTQVPATKARRRGRAKAVLQDSSQVQIKKEKVSEVGSVASEASSTCSVVADDASIKQGDVVVKTEKEEMPAPTQLPPRKKKVKTEPDVSSLRGTRSTRTRGKKAKGVRDSDIEIAERTITTINLEDSDDSVVSEDQTTRAGRKKTAAQSKTDSESETEADKGDKRPTRTRTLKKNPKTAEEPAQVNADPDKKVEELEVRSTRTRTIRNKPKNPSEETESESEQAKKEETITNDIDESAVRITRTRTLRKAKPVLPVESEEIEKQPVNMETKPKQNEETKGTKTEGKRKKEVNNKRSRSDSDSPKSEGESKDKKIKSDGGDGNITNKTEYEDAVSNVGSSTFIAQNASIVNTTVVVEKSKLPVMVEKSKSLKSVAPIVTDDESDNDDKTPPRKLNKLKTTKEVFSPDVKMTLKKKVEAFEKLNILGTSSKTSSAVKPKPFITPQNKFRPLVSSTSRLEKLHGHFENSLTNESTSTRSNSALKASTKEFSERQLREKEALKKKEAMLQAVTEEKKRKNQEKQLKAQLHRKVIESENQKKLEIIKKREEEKKMLLAEKEEYLQKQKEEAEKARQQKKQDMEVKKQKEQQEHRKPVYLLTEPPLLPTDDCYDSDDSRYQHSQRNKVEQKWCKSEHLRSQQFVMLAAGEKIKNTLFCRTAKTPDLRELLDVVDARVLRRNSSAVWRKPPRYTLVAGLDGTVFSEDDE